MAELRNCLHAVVPAPLMEDGVAVVDLREYIAKIDREYATQRPVGIVRNRPIRHEIILEDGAVPPRGCIYCMSEEELEVLRTQLDDLIDKGWTRPSCSPYGVPVFFVRKKNKELRLCIDYRKLNAQTIKNVDPLPRIDDLLERLGGAKYFSKLDLEVGYHQLEIHPRDMYKTAFKTRYGHFEWVVMPFGLMNASATFQAAMTTEFRDMLNRFVLIYLDDILMYNRTLDEHIVHLRAVLDRLRTAKYKANRAKCEFAQQELEYLGHFVTLQGIRPLADIVDEGNKKEEYGRWEREPQRLQTLCSSFLHEDEGVIVLGKPHAGLAWELLRAGNHVFACDGSSKDIAYLTKVIEILAKDPRNDCTIEKHKSTQRSDRDMYHKLGKKREKMWEYLFQGDTKTAFQHEYIYRKAMAQEAYGGYHKAEVGAFALFVA
ncbi:hypothetical protein CBR_g17864 [Chara braunii]|uniref:Reverse transcriptase domain-containing protein n=1 Tax=Chara braunii TaxID=69332 RepID=A0A388KVS5_CHABU|nr:hypothetical protein CBR_g17864 [Chara braunii]|eukprot:GBG74151.1 hypothetical protein CBR_g17864 [Chara braunii]